MSGTISESRGIAGETVIEEVLLMQPLNSSETTSNGEGPDGLRPPYGRGYILSYYF